MEYTTEQLEQMVTGKPEKPRAVFFEKAMLSVEESKKEGRRVYHTTVYVKLSHAGVRDSVAYKATKQDIAAYPEEYAHFQRTRQGAHRTVPVNIIPGLELVHMQELIDMGLSTVDQLAKANTVPPHLEYARKSAITLSKVLQEQENGNEEEGHSEEGIGEEARKADDVSASSGREHPRDLRRPESPPSAGLRNGEAPEGNGQGGREHYRTGGLIRMA
jgi:hypothetical protein